MNRSINQKNIPEKKRVKIILRIKKFVVEARYVLTPYVLCVIKISIIFFI